MADTQYELFRDLDRHCVAGGVQTPDCLEAVRRKREAITSALNQDNPLIRDVAAGRTTFVAIYDEFSHGFRGVHRFLPMPHDDDHNERLQQLARVVPNVRHFTRRSIFATDNPATCTVYGVLASIAIALVAARAVMADDEAAGFDGVMLAMIAILCGVLGFVAGLFAMYKYRTRDPNRIHAREAAAYMDLNYNCHRTFDDEAWAKFIALKTAAPATLTPVPEPSARNARAQAAMP
jgi:hypothetical protein